ncbi:MAG: hypothetical protein NSGCLCUN01_00283 [uncultured Clostridium sp.]
MKEKIENYIKEKKISNNEFAKQVGVSKGTISRLLNGKGISITTAKKIAKSINITLDELI